MRGGADEEEMDVVLEARRRLVKYVREALVGWRFVL